MSVDIVCRHRKYFPFTHGATGGGASVFDTGVISLRFAAKRYILHQKCLKKLIGSCLLETRGYNYADPERHNTQLYRRTDIQTDGRIDDIIMPRADHSYAYNMIS